MSARRRGGSEVGERENRFVGVFVHQLGTGQPKVTGGLGLPAEGGWGSVQTPLGFTEGTGLSESGLSSMCQVPWGELERDSRLETRQAAGCWLHKWPGEGDRCFGEGGAELGSEGQAGAGEAADQATVRWAAAPGPGLLRVRHDGRNGLGEELWWAGVPGMAGAGLTQENAGSEQRLSRKKGKSRVCFDYSQPWPWQSHGAAFPSGRAVPGIAGLGAAHLASPSRPSSVPKCDSHKCPQTLSSVPRGTAAHSRDAPTYGLIARCEERSPV